jgi:hypothetical protein
VSNVDFLRAEWPELFTEAVLPSESSPFSNVDVVTEQAGFAVVALWIYPTKDEPGVGLTAVKVEPEGLSGDRRKKAALHLVCEADAAEQAPRANLVLDAAADQLDLLVGKRMRLGTSEIEITGKPSNCPGVYGAVLRPGTISVGDRLEASGR